MHAQLKKLEHKVKFLREFWTNYEVEKGDLSLIKEEALAERVALTVLKSGEAKGMTAENLLWMNEFGSGKELLIEKGNK